MQLWGWLRVLTGQHSHSATLYALPPLEKAEAAAADRQPQQQQQKEYCLRMAFKLTPKYSSKLQVGTTLTAGGCAVNLVLA